MKIYELTPGQAVTIIVQIGGENRVFNTEIQEVFGKKRIVLAAPIFQDEKIISFRAPNLITDVLVTLSDDKPQLFKNVTISIMRKADKSLCYQLSTIAESKSYNRRQNFRCYVGVESSLLVGANRVAHEVIIKDISAEGFAFVCPHDLEILPDQLVHTVLNDFLEELMENFSFHLYGIVVRSYSLEDNRLVYGCRLNNRINGLDSYIMKKERLRLRKSNGGKL